MTDGTHHALSELDRVDIEMATTMGILHGLDDAVSWWDGREDEVDGPGGRRLNLGYVSLMLEPAVAHLEAACQRLGRLMETLRGAPSGDDR